MLQLDASIFSDESPISNDFDRSLIIPCSTFSLRMDGNGDEVVQTCVKQKARFDICPIAKLPCLGVEGNSNRSHNCLASCNPRI